MARPRSKVGMIKFNVAGSVTQTFRAEDGFSHATVLEKLVDGTAVTNIHDNKIVEVGTGTVIAKIIKTHVGAETVLDSFVNATPPPPPLKEKTVKAPKAKKEKVAKAAPVAAPEVAPVAETTQTTETTEAPAPEVAQTTETPAPEVAPVLDTTETTPSAA